MLWREWQGRIFLHLGRKDPGEVILQPGKGG
jgi:hypothetical protein